MKAYLIFKLPEEREEHMLALKAGEYASALYDVEQYLRKLYKYDSDRVEKLSAAELLEEIRNEFYSLTEGLEL
jgi:hypothetical protein